MKRVLLGLCALVLACVLTPTASAQPSAAPLEGHACAPMRWHSSDDHARIALSTSVRINGHEYWFQLDTGAWETMLYGAEADRRNWTRRSQNNFTPTNFEAGGAALVTRPIVAQRGMGAGDPAGTLGLSALQGRLTIIDYPGLRLCILPPGAEVTLAQRARWSPARVRRQKFYTPIQIGARTYADVVFDTGSSRFPLWTDLTLWSALTGQTNPADAPAAVHGMAWGHPKIWRGAPMRDAMTIGGVTVSGALAFVDETEPNMLARIPAQALFGNALLWDHIVLLDMRTGDARFGVAD